MGAGPAKKLTDHALPPLRTNDESQLAMLPWLAKGFGPVHTSNQSSLCGLFALCIAFQTAREYLKTPGENVTHLTPDRFIEIFKSDEYFKLVDTTVAAQKAAMWVDQENTELKDTLTQTSNLDIVSAFYLNLHMLIHLKISRTKST